MPHRPSQQFTAALDALVEQIKEDRSILAAILCGSLSHDTVWAKSDIDLVLVTIDDKQGRAGRRRAVRRRRERPRAPDAARAVPQDGRRLGPQLVHALAAGEGPAALHARRDDRRPLRAAADDRRARHRSCSCCARRPSALPADLQGAQVVRHARRSRLHRAVDPLRRDAARADRGDRRAACSPTAR